MRPTLALREHHIRHSPLTQSQTRTRRQGEEREEAPSWRTMLALLFAPPLAAVLHSRLSRRAVGSSAALCSSLVLPRAAAASDFQTAEAATASQFAAAEAARAARQRDSLQLRRGFELKLSAVQDATTAREFVAASDALARVENTAGCAWLARQALTIGECDAGQKTPASRTRLPGRGP